VTPGARCTTLAGMDEKAIRWSALITLHRAIGERIQREDSPGTAWTRGQSKRQNQRMLVDFTDAELAIVAQACRAVAYREVERRGRWRTRRCATRSATRRGAMPRWPRNSSGPGRGAGSSINGMNEPPDNVVAETTLEFFKQARDQAHVSAERAAKDTTKILSTLHAGLAITSAAWLQRLFERSDISGFMHLAVSLDVTITFNMIGLLLLAAAALVDSMTPGFITESSKIAHVRVLRTLQRGNTPEDGESDADLEKRGYEYEARYLRWNTVSHWLGRAIWSCSTVPLRSAWSKRNFSKFASTCNLVPRVGPARQGCSR
jgi:hypothetical protein